MPPTPVALDARVSTDQHTEAQTVASHVAAFRERVATRVRPALERWRDGSAAGAIDRLSVHSPDRLARTYAYQVLLVEACRRAGVEGMCRNRALGQSPEDALLLQVQGMIAEDARAKIIERHRRGTRHAARSGVVHGLSGAPSGYHDVAKDAGGGRRGMRLCPPKPGSSAPCVTGSAATA